MGGSGPAPHPSPTDPHLPFPRLLLLDMCARKRGKCGRGCSGVRVRVRIACARLPKSRRASSMRRQRARACPRRRSARAAAQQVYPSARRRAHGVRSQGGVRRSPAGPRATGCMRVTFCRLWKCERPRRQGLPPAAGREASERARRRPSPTSASRLFLVPGSQGPSVLGETRRRGPTPAGAAHSHDPPSPRGSRETEPAGALGAAEADMDPNPRAALERQQLRLRERQKFFEDILQPETEFVFPLSHLHLESQRPPIGSISSMEVNVDALEQVELIDLGDQDGADVFLPCEDPPPTPQTSGVDDHPEELSLPVPPSDRTTSRTSSSSSDSSINLHSPNPSDGGADTPLAQSDEEDDGGDRGAERRTCS